MPLTYLLGPPARTGRPPVWQLREAGNRKVTAKLTDSSEAGFTIDGDHPDALRIDELATDLHVLWSYTAADRKQWLYRGRVGPTTDALPESGEYDLTVTTLDYKAVLARRYLMSGSRQVWSGVDQGLIGWGLIDTVQNRLGGDLGIRPHPDGIGTGVLRDRAYNLGDEVRQRIDELSEVLDGFEWDIVPGGARGADLYYRTWYPQRGVDRGIILQKGKLAASITRNVDPATYANAIRVTGSAPEGGGAEPPPHEGYAPDIETAPQGRWDAVESTSITTTPALAERRDWIRDERQVVRPTYTVKLAPGVWRGPGHIWLGDTCRLVLFRGRLQLNKVPMRVHEITVTPGKGEHDDVELTLNGPKPDLRRRSLATDRRLSDLERR